MVVLEAVRNFSVAASLNTRREGVTAIGTQGAEGLAIGVLTNTVLVMDDVHGIQIEDLRNENGRRLR